MDSEWKEQNQIPEEPNSVDQKPPEPIATPSPQVPAPKPQPAVPEPSADFTPMETDSTGRNKRIIIAAIGLAIIIAIVAVVYLLFTHNKANNQNNSSQTQQTDQGIKIPDDWKVIDTGLGFTIKGPQAWTAPDPIQSDSKGIKYTYTQIKNYNQAADSEDYVIAATQSNAQATTRDEFEKKLTDPAALEAQAKAVGLTKEQFKATSSRIDINGEQWLQVDSKIPDQISRILFFWVGDHAVVLGVTAKDQAKLDRLIKQFLEPMAASVELTNSNSD